MNFSIRSFKPIPFSINADMKNINFDLTYLMSNSPSNTEIKNTDYSNFGLLQKPEVRPEQYQSLMNSDDLDKNSLIYRNILVHLLLINKHPLPRNFQLGLL